MSNCLCQGDSKAHLLPSHWRVMKVLGAAYWSSVLAKCLVLLRVIKTWQTQTKINLSLSLTGDANSCVLLTASFKMCLLLHAQIPTPTLLFWLLGSRTMLHYRLLHDRVKVQRNLAVADLYLFANLKNPLLWRKGTQPFFCKVSWYLHMISNFVPTMRPIVWFISICLCFSFLSVSLPF